MSQFNLREKKMRIFFGSLVLIFMLSCNEIEASGLKKLIPRKKSSEKDEDQDSNRVDSLGTSRYTTTSAMRRNPTSREHEALDLHRLPPYGSGPVTPWDPTLNPRPLQNQALFMRGYRPDVPVSSIHQSSTEVLDHVQKFKMRHEQYSQGASTTRMIQSDQHQKQKRTPPIPVGPEWRKRDQKTQESKEIEANMEEAPEGLPNPVFQPQFSSRNMNINSHLHEVDHSAIPAEYQRRTRLSANTPRRQVVSNFHDLFSQQSQPPQHAFQYHQRELMQNDMSGDNLYLEVRLDQNGAHHLYYNWDYSGGPGSSSQN